MTNDSIYKTEPKCHISGIPVFSDVDNDYIVNYKRIAIDHVEAISKGITNPFIDEVLWNAMEDSTLKLIMKCISQYEIRKELKILDVGVGLGRLIEKIKAKVDNHRILSFYGIDIAMPYLNIAKSKGINVAFSRLEDMPYKESSFDIVLCADVLEHVLDLNLCINKLINALKDDGYLIIRVPNKEDLSIYLRDDYPYMYAHVRNFDSASLRLMLTKIFSLNVVKMVGDVFYPIPSLYKCKISTKIPTVISRVVRPLGRYIGNTACNKILSIFYDPVELNCIARKI